MVGQGEWGLKEFTNSQDYHLKSTSEEIEKTDTTIIKPSLK